MRRETDGLVGAGRTETFKIVSGVMKRDFFHGGEVLLNEKPVRYRVPAAAVKAGIAYVTEDRKVEGFFETASGLVLTNAHVVGMLHADEGPPQKVDVVLQSGQKDEKTLAQLAQQFDVHASQITTWKEQLLER